MRFLHSARWILMALVLSIVSAPAFAGVFISVNFAPPVMPVYEQPPCPEPGWMWTPGYWAYGPDGYYWVPGAWVPAPYEGALWTPGYWGWGESLYVWHPGYWGRHVGYYGGVNYGFGYMGIGFVGGMWRGHDFVYNRAVMHVNDRYIHNTYEDRTVIVNHTVVNNRVAFNGGPNGVRYQPRPEERVAMHEQHMAPTSFQTQHMAAAQADRGMYFKTNNGRPQTMAVQRPMGYNGGQQNGNGQFRGQGQQPQQFNQQQRNNQPQQFNRGQQSQPQSRQPQQYNQGQQRQQYQSQPQQQYRQQPQAQPQQQRYQQPPARPQSQPQSQPRNQGQPHNEGQPRGQGGGQGGDRPHGNHPGR
ncbi:MAG: YXWGXW repeat-containing protein [Terracidiphilus sp.]|nr:YXWGXW repeat-containing protein [Terracidiphilus sp.]